MNILISSWRAAKAGKGNERVSYLKEAKAQHILESTGG